MYNSRFRARGETAAGGGARLAVVAGSRKLGAPGGGGAPT